MIYLLESKLPENKSVFYALTYIYGINRNSSILICNKLGFSSNFKIKNLNKEQVNRLTKLIEEMSNDLSSNLKKSRFIKNKKLISIKSYRGMRRTQGLPLRGQRTHTNSRTSRKKLF